MERACLPKPLVGNSTASSLNAYFATIAEGFAPVAMTANSALLPEPTASVRTTETSLDPEFRTKRYKSSGVRYIDSGCAPTAIEAITERLFGGSSTETVFDP
jgi:hypothetical protein